MAVLNPQISALVLHLKHSAQQAEKELNRVASCISHEPAGCLLRNTAELRGQLARELADSLPQGESPNGRARVLPEVWTDLDTSAPDSSGLLEHCRSRDEQTLRQYQWVLKREMPPTVRRVLSRQHAALSADYQRLCQMIAGLAGSPTPATHSGLNGTAFHRSS